MGDNIDIPVAAKRAIIENKIRVYKNTLYDIQIDSRVAAVIGDEQEKEAIKGRAERIVRAIVELESALSEVNK